MDSGNWRPGNPRTEVIYCRVPAELKWLVELYGKSCRSMTLSDTMRRLLESHPALTDLAGTITIADSTSPPLTEDQVTR